MKKLQLNALAISETGLSKQDNQDRVLALIGEDCTGDFGLFVVADGMGGQRGGAQAAESAIRACEEWWNGVLPRLISGDREQIHGLGIKSLREAIGSVNAAVLEYGKQWGLFPGTTLSVLFIYGTGYGFVHVGDSRIYRAHDGLHQITPDDTWVAHQIQKGFMTTAEAYNHPKRHLLTQCVGSGKEMFIHCGQGVLMTRMSFVVCSDGFYNHLTDEEVLFLAQLRQNREKGLYDSVEAIYARGATDNFSAIIINL